MDGSPIDSHNPFALNPHEDRSQPSENNKTNWKASFDCSQKSSIDSNLLDFDPLIEKNRVFEPSSSLDLVAVSVPQNKVNYSPRLIPLPQSSCSSRNPFEIEPSNDPWSVSPSQNQEDLMFSNNPFDPFKATYNTLVDDEVLEKFFGKISDDQFEYCPEEPLKPMICQSSKEPHDAVIEEERNNPPNNKDIVNNFFGINPELIDIDNLAKTNCSSLSEPSSSQRKNSVGSSRNPFDNRSPETINEMRQKKLSIHADSPLPELSVIYSSPSASFVPPSVASRPQVNSDASPCTSSLQKQKSSSFDLFDLRDELSDSENKKTE